MKYIALFILIGFLGMISVGFMTMNHDHHDMMNSAELPCPIAVMLNIVCTGNGASMALSHISALQSFLNTPASFALFLSLLLLCIGILFDIFARDVSSLRNAGRFKLQKFLVLQGFLEKQRSWLSLFEHSPSFA